MAIEDTNTGMYMPVAPAYGNNGGFMNGGDGWWIILLLLACGGGWGNGFGGWGGGYGNMALGYDFPWLLQGQNGINANTNAGFDHAATQSAIGDLSTAVTTGFGNVATQLCGGFAGVNATVNNAQNALAQQLYTNQISDLERSFAAQTANTAALSGLSQQLSTCCCENRAGIADLKYTVASEACADRAALQAGIQTILDKMCQQELDAERRDNQNLRSELMYARGQASQVAQTAAIEASQSAQTQYIVNRVAPYPIPAYVVPNPVGTGTTTGGTT
jgi:hypothetical protein